MARIILVVGILLGIISLSKCDDGDADKEVTLEVGPNKVKVMASQNVSRPINGSARPFLAFRNIQYARVKTRFLNAEPVPITETLKPGVLTNLTKPGPICAQMRKFPLGPIGSEHCLSLNIFVPEAALPVLGTPKPPLPVIFYVHGGAWKIGTSATYGGKYFMQEDVVLVTFNYRLGIFGFLASPAGGIPGNAGLFDQLQALEWVKANIAVFGGDPNKITLMGESAGAASVGHFLVSPKARDNRDVSGKPLFKKAILQSATPMNFWAFRPLSKSNDFLKMFVATLRGIGTGIDAFFIELGFGTPFGSTPLDEQGLPKEGNPAAEKAAIQHLLDTEARFHGQHPEDPYPQLAPGATEVDVVKFLQSAKEVCTEAIIWAQTLMLPPTDEFAPFPPVYDDVTGGDSGFLPARPDLVFYNGDARYFNKVPTFITACTHESDFMDPIDIALKFPFGKSPNEALASLLGFDKDYRLDPNFLPEIKDKFMTYVIQEYKDPKNPEVMAKILSDRFFLHGIVDTAVTLSSKNVDVFVGLFTRPGTNHFALHPKYTGVSHADDLQYFFNASIYRPNNPLTEGIMTQNSQSLVRIWADIAKIDPKDISNLGWPNAHSNKRPNTRSVEWVDLGKPDQKPANSYDTMLYVWDQLYRKYAAPDFVRKNYPDASRPLSASIQLLARL